MTTPQRDAALELAPNKLKSTFTLAEASCLVSIHGANAVPDLARLRPHIGAQSFPEVPDPIGQNEEFFAEVGTQISNLILPILSLFRDTPSPTAS